VVVIHNAELLAESDDATGTTGLKLGAELLEESLAALVGGSWGATDLSAEDFAGELSIVEGAGTVLIVKVVESIKILIRINKI
jgi:hypothetical protein